MGKSTKLATEQLRTLDRLKAARGTERFYLAGGTAGLSCPLWQHLRDAGRPEVHGAGRRMRWSMPMTDEPAPAMVVSNDTEAGRCWKVAGGRRSQMGAGVVVRR
jgi:hypothetical protein